MTTIKPWRERAGTTFACSKGPARGTRGMVATNHPLASAAGAEMVAAGGNAIDATIAAFFALSVVEPMMVGIAGGGLMHIRSPDGRHIVLDGLGTAPAATSPDCYVPMSHTWPDYLETEGRANSYGVRAVAVPGSLQVWCTALDRFGTLSLSEVLEPAIRFATRGFVASPYLADCIAEAADDLDRDSNLRTTFCRRGRPVQAGERIYQPALADVLRSVERYGAATLYGGELGRALADHIQSEDGFLTLRDLVDYRLVERQPVRGTYRGYEIVGPPPPASAGVHIVQMLNILEDFDVAQLGFGTAETLHLLAEVLSIAFADRSVATGDPDFFLVPVDRLISKEYADSRRREIDLSATKAWAPGPQLADSPNTTHVTVADDQGNVVAATQTIHSLFGARFTVRGTGLLPNNYMYTFDPHPGRIHSVAPGKRVPTSQAPVVVLQDGRPRYALGLPGGLRIFGSVLQSIVNLIDHGMSIQEAVEAPRIWTQGGAIELEPAFSKPVRETLRRYGHNVVSVPHVAGGMNAIAFDDDGTMTGAACWRADGAAMSLGGGQATPGVRKRELPG